jgi:serine/threonine protein phosphatase PrpC
MEDQNYFVSFDGRFAAIFDGHHGGSGDGSNAVTDYLKTRLYDAACEHVSMTRQSLVMTEEAYQGRRSPVSVPHLTAALRSAFTLIDREILAEDDDSLSVQGSTALAVVVDEDKEGRRTLVTANVGDSRAVLSRRGQAVAVTRDHTLSDDKERDRLKLLGEKIDWDPTSKTHRVRDVCVPRAFGYKKSKPAVSGAVDLQQFPLNDYGDEFVLLASAGFWYVFSNQEAVSYVQEKLAGVTGRGSWENAEERKKKEATLKTMSRSLAREAYLRKGDNISVLIVWLKDY